MSSQVGPSEGFSLRQHPYQALQNAESAGASLEVDHPNTPFARSACH